MVSQVQALSHSHSKQRRTWEQSASVSISAATWLSSCSSLVFSDISPRWSGEGDKLVAAMRLATAMIYRTQPVFQLIAIAGCSCATFPGWRRQRGLWLRGGQQQRIVCTDYTGQPMLTPPSTISDAESGPVSTKLL
jgi:hypothetical protein